MTPEYFCPQCGPLFNSEWDEGPLLPRIDEDGCCAQCGCTTCEWLQLTEFIAACGFRVIEEEEERVLADVAAIPTIELNSSGNWYGWAKPIGEAERKRRAKCQST